MLEDSWLKKINKDENIYMFFSGYFSMPARPDNLEIIMIIIMTIMIVIQVWCVAIKVFSFFCMLNVFYNLETIYTERFRMH